MLQNGLGAMSADLGPHRPGRGRHHPGVRLRYGLRRPRAVAVPPGPARLGIGRLLPTSFWSALPEPAAGQVQTFSASPRGRRNVRDETPTMAALSTNSSPRHADAPHPPQARGDPQARLPCGTPPTRLVESPSVIEDVSTDVRRRESVEVTARPAVYRGGTLVSPPQACSGSGAGSEVRDGLLHRASKVGAEAGGGGTVDDVVVDGHREVQDVPHDDLVADDPWAPARATQDHHQRSQGRWGDRKPPPAANIPTAVTCTVPVT